jgi:hypothetical protein
MMLANYPITLKYAKNLQTENIGAMYAKNPRGSRDLVPHGRKQRANSAFTLKLPTKQSRALDLYDRPGIFQSTVS